MGFRSVADLVGGRVAWTVLGLPTEGAVGDGRRVGRYVRAARTVDIGATIADVVAALAAGASDDGDGESEHGDGEPIGVIGAGGVLLGVLDPLVTRLPAATFVEDIMVTAPGTIRPDVRLDDALQQLDDDHLAHTLVTTARGVLVGLLVRDAHV